MIRLDGLAVNYDLEPVPLASFSAMAIDGVSAKSRTVFSAIAFSTADHRVAARAGVGRILCRQDGGRTHNNER